MRKVLVFGSTVIGVILIILSWSCKRDSTNDSDTRIYSYKNDVFFTSLSTAIEVAANIDESNTVLKIANKTRLTTPKYSGKRKIKDNLTILDKEKQNPYFYVLNYESGGYSIISADQRLTPIVGYSDQGYFKLDSMPSGLVGWFETTAMYMKHLRTSNAKPSAFVSSQWTSLRYDQNRLKSAPPTPPNPDDYEVDVVVGPLLHTTWYQDCGYNTYCPILSGAPINLCGHAWTGCSTTAIAQVMTYWKYPAKYNWGAMSLNSGNDAVAVLMGDIFPFVIGSYDSGGSSCTNDYNITHAFLNMGYKSASLAGYVNGITYNGGYNYQTVISNLDVGKPVILGGYDSQRSILGLYSYAKVSANGHLWVCDGYRQTTFSIETYLLFHMNWGKSGSFNGWYAFNDWSSPSGSYNYCTDMIYNIHP